MNTGDQSLIKSLNRKIILETIIEKQSISRAQLSKMTGLNKATITSQVGELLNDGIVVETEFDVSTGGRKPILLTLNDKAAYAIGIELDIDKINILLTDLMGNIVEKHIAYGDMSSLEDTRELLIKLVNKFMRLVPTSRYGIVGIGLGIHGMVDKNEEIVLAPHFKWKYINLKQSLADKFNVPIFIDNNTNLIAYAEKAFSTDVRDVFCLTVSSGIGLGIVIDNGLYKGFNGLAGEVGHMITHVDGRECSCGNKGCWERYASEKAFLEALAIAKKERHCSMEQVYNWIKEDDQTTLNSIKEFAKELSIGINNIINTFNPETMIINSDLLNAYPEMLEMIKSSLSSNISSYRHILYSKIGGNACALGACIVAISHFLEIQNFKNIKNS